MPQARDRIHLVASIRPVTVLSILHISLAPIYTDTSPHITADDRNECHAINQPISP